MMRNGLADGGLKVKELQGMQFLYQDIVCNTVMVNLQLILVHL